jgi:hypothetical protein
MLIHRAILNLLWMLLLIYQWVVLNGMILATLYRKSSTTSEALAVSPSGATVCQIRIIIPSLTLQVMSV